MLVRIDGVITAVDKRDLKIDKRIAGDGAARGSLNDAFFDRGPKVLRHRAAKDLIDPLKSTATRQRLEDHLAIAKLSSAAGLFLMPALDLGGCRDRFLV